MHQKSHKFWKDFSIERDRGAKNRDLPHPAGASASLPRKCGCAGVAAVRRLLRRPAARWLTAQAWHCDTENKIFAIHAIHPRGDLEVFEKALDKVTCH